MRILVACEESQRVCISFREKGHEAYSCDIQECSGGHPEWHIFGDCLPLLNGNCEFVTQDGQKHFIPGKWDMIIAHPPCTFLTVSGNRWFNVYKYGEKAYERKKLQKEAISFFMNFVFADCEKIAIENPIGIISTVFKKPSQIIHPYFFGDPERKATCLWLKGLPPLKATNIVDPNIVYYKNGKGSDSLWHINTINMPVKLRQKERSKTFWGVAQAMAEQWGCINNNAD